MSKYEKLLLRILKGTSDRNISFDELCHLLRRLGFEERVRGISEKVNLQRDNDKAKAYQVHQVRNVILKYNLAEEL